MKGKAASGATLTLLLSMSVLAFDGFTAQSVITIGIGVYWDSSSMNQVSSINWGILQPGSIEDVIVYVRNEGNVPATLSIASASWNPPAASSYMTLNWNYTGEVLEPSSVVPVELSLFVISSIVGIYVFSFDCVLSATGSSTASVWIATCGSITRTWIVDDDGLADFHSIQGAINAANPGDTVYVKTGIYCENIIADKNSLALVGEGKETTIIDGSGGIAVRISASDISVCEFTIVGSYPYGIYLSNKTRIFDSNIARNYVGIGYGATPTDCAYNVVISNNTVNKNAWGIELSVSNSAIFGNNITGNSLYGIKLAYSGNNAIYHNSLVNNNIQAYAYESINLWDDGYPSGGNYWSDYTLRYPDAQELDDSGIWDTPYVIDENNQDNYPLMDSWTPTPPTIMASLDIDPDTLNLKSKGEWITAYIQLPEGYNASDIDASAILLNDTIAPVLNPKYGYVTNPSEYLVDHNSDGVLERMVKFDRAGIASWIYQSIGMRREVRLTITGELADGTPFEGTDAIFVFWPCRKSPTKR